MNGRFESREFSLMPFPGQWAPAGIQINGRVERSRNIFSFRIELAGGGQAAGPGLSPPALHRAAPEGATGTPDTLQFSIGCVASRRMASDRAAGMPSALDCLDIPAPAPHPERKDSLWENTCFEFFLAPAGSPHYWEFNLSPSGDWNVYRFDSYRRGMRAEDAFSDFPFRVDRSPDVLAVSGRFVWGSVLGAVAAGAGGTAPSDGHPDLRALDAGISAVLKGRNGQISYWALTHCRERPDFHARESFIIRMAV